MPRSIGIIFSLSETQASPNHFPLFLRRPVLRILNNDGLQALDLLLLDIHGLHVAVQLLLGAFLVVTFSADPHAEAEGDALDPGFPDLFVELGVESDVAGSLMLKSVSRFGRLEGLMKRWERHASYHGPGSEAADLLDCAGGSLLEAYAVDLL